MSGKQSVWVAFVTVNVGDHDQTTDFLSVHTTLERAKDSALKWVGLNNSDAGDPEGEEWLEGTVWLDSPNGGASYLVKEGTVYDRVCAGEAEVFAEVEKRELDEKVEYM